MTSDRSIYERLSLVQAELKAPKNQTNKFGNYNYRSCEDILEAVKPILNKHNLVLTISDTLMQIGERYYVEAKARIIDTVSGTTCEVTAYAREEETKKGMDASQITGAASSYARKYALNGLFNIDDNKDADTDEHRNQNDRKPTPLKAQQPEHLHRLNEEERQAILDQIAVTATDEQWADLVTQTARNPHDRKREAVWCLLLEQAPTATILSRINNYIAKVNQRTVHTNAAFEKRHATVINDRTAQSGIA